MSRTRLASGFASALAIIAMTTASLGTSLSAANAAPNPTPTQVAAPTKTISFLDRAFTNNEIVLYGSPEYGVTLEAMLARKAAGYRLTQQLGAVKRILADRAVVSYNKTGYLFTKDGTFRAGRAGLFLFTSVALGVPNRPLQLTVFNDLKASIAKDGSVALAQGNSVEYAWITLGLHAFNQDELANRVLRFAELKQNSDGGFAGWSPVSSTDATGIMLQAQSKLRTFGGAKVVAARKLSIGKAVGFLRKAAQGSDHWMSDNGDGSSSDDVNGTAYATMGLLAAGVDATRPIAWLKSQIADDGGIKSAWSGASGDVFATAQGLTPLLGKSYVQLLGKR